MPCAGFPLSSRSPSLAALPAAAQQSPEDQARRLLDDGRTYRAQGKAKQALDNFNIVVSSFPGTEAVGDALLEIGRYRAEVEGDSDKARAAFEQVTKEHARGGAAAGAYYNLGLLTLARGDRRGRGGRRPRAVRARGDALPAQPLGAPRARRVGRGPPPRRPLRGGGRRRAARVARVPGERRGGRGPVRARPGPRSARRAAARRWRSCSRCATASRRASGRAPRSSGSPRSTGCSAARSRPSRPTRRSRSARATSSRTCARSPTRPAVRCGSRPRRPAAR